VDPRECQQGTPYYLSGSVSLGFADLPEVLGYLVVPFLGAAVLAVAASVPVDLVAVGLVLASLPEVLAVVASPGVAFQAFPVVPDP